MDVAAVELRPAEGADEVVELVSLRRLKSGESGRSVSYRSGPSSKEDLSFSLALHFWKADWATSSSYNVLPEVPPAVIL